MSSIVNVAVEEEAFSHPSITVNVTVALPVAAQSSESDAKSLLQEISPQTSVADASPFASNHASNSALFPSPSHSTVRFCAMLLNSGAEVSTTEIN